MFSSEFCEIFNKTYFYKNTSDGCFWSYSVQPRGRMFVKIYGILSFARNIGKNIGRNISKNLSSKYSQKLLDHNKQSTTDAIKTVSKTVIQKTAESTGDFIGN